MRTINRDPYSVKVGTNDEQYFNMSNPKGLCTNKNYVGIDQETFSEVDNMYINADDELSTRPPIVRKSISYIPADADVIKIFTENEITFYQWKKQGNNYFSFSYNNKSYTFGYGSDEQNGGNPFTDLKLQDNTQIVWNGDRYIVFTKNDDKTLEGLYSFKYNFDTDNFDWYHSVDTTYVPVKEIYFGNTKTDNEYPNLYNSSYYSYYNFDYNTRTNTDNIIDDTVQLKILDKTYTIKWQRNSYDIFITKLGNIDVNTIKYANKKYLAYNMTSGKNYSFYYSTDGIIFKEYTITEEFFSYKITSSEIETVVENKFEISDDGSAIWFVPQGMTITSTTSNNNRSYYVLYRFATDTLQWKQFVFPVNSISFNYKNNGGTGMQINCSTKYSPKGYGNFALFASPNKERACILCNIQLSVTAYLNDTDFYSETGTKVANNSSVQGMVYLLLYDKNSTTYNADCYLMSNRGNIYYGNASRSIRDNAILKYILPISTDGSLLNVNACITLALQAFSGNTAYLYLYTSFLYDVDEDADKHFIPARNFPYSWEGANNIEGPVYFYSDYSSYRNADNLSFSMNAYYEEFSNIFNRYWIKEDLQDYLYTDVYTITENIKQSDVSIYNYNTDLSLSSANIKNVYPIKYTYSGQWHRNNSSNNYKMISESPSNKFRVSKQGQVLTNLYYYNSAETLILPYNFEPINVDDGIFILQDENKTLYSNVLNNTDFITVIKFNNGSINYKYPDLVYSFYDLVMSNNNELYWTTYKDGLLYVKYNKDTKEGDFEYLEDIVTAIALFSQTTLGIFLRNSVWQFTYNIASDKQSVFYTLLPTKLKLGNRKGDDVILNYDGQSIFVNTLKGLSSLTYQDFVQSTEQIYSYLTDRIIDDYNRYYNDDKPIKLCIHKYWLFVYRQDVNYIYLMDLRSATWWKWTLYSPIKQVATVNYDLQLLIDSSVGGKIYEFDLSSLSTSDIGQYPFDWKFTSQKLHFNAPNNYKNIRNISIVTSQDGNKMRFKLKFKNYRNLYNPTDVDTVQYDINELTTVIKKVNFMKTNAFQFTVENDKTDVLPEHFVTPNISIKYRITERLR